MKLSGFGVNRKTTTFVCKIVWLTFQNESLHETPKKEDRKWQLFPLGTKESWLIKNAFDKDSYCIFINDSLEFFQHNSSKRERKKIDPILTVIILSVSPSLLNAVVTSWFSSFSWRGDSVGTRQVCSDSSQILHWAPGIKPTPICPVA